MGQFSKKWEDLQFSDNFIFCKVMRNKDLCKEMLEILLGIKVQDIEYIQSEHPLDDYYETRGVRMDVFVQGSNEIYNMEMQTGDYDDLLMRSRYYLGAADVSTTPLVEINDKSHKLFYNCSAYAKAADEDVSSVLEFIYNLKANSKFTKKLHDSVIMAKAEPIFRDEYMYFADILEDEVEKAQEQGAIKKAEESAIECLKDNVPIENVAKWMKLPLERVQELAEQIKNQN